MKKYGVMKITMQECFCEVINAENEDEALAMILSVGFSTKPISPNLIALLEGIKSPKFIYYAVSEIPEL